MIHVGLDIGGSSVKAAVFRNGRCIKTVRSADYSQPGHGTLQTAMAWCLQGVEDVGAVGVCLPGLVDSKTRKVIACANIPSLVGVRVESFVRMTLRIGARAPVKICSDALAAAFDIQHERRLKGRLLVLVLGTGVGCAVLDGTKPLDVDHASAGHIGQIDVSIAGHDVIGPDGGAGGLEGYIGAPALRKLHPEMPPDQALATYSGDEPAIRALVRAIRVAHAIYRPQHVVLAGGIGMALRHLLPTIKRQVQRDLTSLARPKWTLDCASDLFHAARGAARGTINA